MSLSDLVSGRRGLRAIQPAPEHRQAFRPGSRCAARLVCQHALCAAAAGTLISLGILVAAAASARLLQQSSAGWLWATHDAFDVSQLRGNLPPRSCSRSHAEPAPRIARTHHGRHGGKLSTGILAQQHPPASTTSGALGLGYRFLSAEASQSKMQSQQPSHQMHAEPHAAHAIHPNVIPMGLRMGMMPSSMNNMQYAPSPMQQQHTVQATQTPQLDNAKWAEAFTAFEASTSSATAAAATEPMPRRRQTRRKGRLLGPAGARRARTHRRQARRVGRARQQLQVPPEQLPRPHAQDPRQAGGHPGRQHRRDLRHCQGQGARISAPLPPLPSRSRSRGVQLGQPDGRLGQHATAAAQRAKVARQQFRPARRRARIRTHPAGDPEPPGAQRPLGRGRCQERGDRTPGHGRERTHGGVCGRWRATWRSACARTTPTRENSSDTSGWAPTSRMPAPSTDAGRKT